MHWTNFLLRRCFMRRKFKLEAFSFSCSSAQEECREYSQIISQHSRLAIAFEHLWFIDIKGLSTTFRQSHTFYSDNFYWNLRNYFSPSAPIFAQAKDLCFYPCDKILFSLLKYFPGTNEQELCSLSVSFDLFHRRVFEIKNSEIFIFLCGS